MDYVQRTHTGAELEILSALTGFGIAKTDMHTLAKGTTITICFNENRDMVTREPKTEK